MTDFDHGEWHSIKAALELQPLPPHAADIVPRLLAEELFWYPSPHSYEQAVLARLMDLQLVEFVGGEFCPWDDEEPDEGEVEASEMLRAIESRGLLSGLLP